MSLTKKCRTKNGLRLKNRTRTGVKRKKNRIRQFAFFKISVFFSFFVRILKKIKTDCVLKNGKKTENCRKNAGKKTEISKNGNGRIRLSKFPSFFRFFSVFFIFPFFFRIFSVFQKRNPFFISNFRNKKDGQKTDKRRNFKILFSVFFPFFFRHFLKNPEKCRKKMVLFFSGNLRLCPFLGQKRNVMPEKIRKIPWGLNQDPATCGFFQNNFVFLEKKLKKRKKTVIRF